MEPLVPFSKFRKTPCPHCKKTVAEHQLRNHLRTTHGYSWDRVDDVVQPWSPPNVSRTKDRVGNRRHT